MTGVKENLIGRTFGRLTVIADAERRKLPCGQFQTMFLCRCICGNENPVSAHCLKKGSTISCGCYKYEVDKLRKLTHGSSRRGTRSPTYSTWAAMKNRCTNSRDYAYRNYGARGICVCDKWADSFIEFLADMGEKPSGCSLDRIDVNGNYEPGNCRWATAREQGNNKRNNRILEYRGERLTMSQLSKRTGISRGVISDRIRLGWPIELAAEYPVRRFNRFSKILPMMATGS